MTREGVEEEDRARGEGGGASRNPSRSLFRIRPSMLLPLFLMTLHNAVYRVVVNSVRENYVKRQTDARDALGEIPRLVTRGCKYAIIRVYNVASFRNFSPLRSRER